MSKKILVAAGLLVVLAAVAGVYAYRSYALAEPSVPSGKTDERLALLKKVEKDAPQGIAFLSLGDGARATVKRGSKERAGENNMALLAGDEIQALSGKVEIFYPKAGASLLDPGTSVTVLPNGKPQRGGVGLLIRLKAGAIWTRFERLFEIGEAFSVESSNVVATVRGTGFGVINENGKVQVKVTNHKVRVMSWDDFVKSIGGGDLGLELPEGKELAVNLDELKQGLRELDDFLAMGVEDMKPAAGLDSGLNFADLPLDLSTLKLPDNPAFWSEPPTLTDEDLKFLDSALRQEWEKNADWMKVHQDELKDAERILQELKDQGIDLESPTATVDLINRALTGDEKAVLEDVLTASSTDADALDLLGVPADGLDF